MTHDHDKIMANLPSAILFDLDGTLVDSAQDLYLALNHILHLSGRPEMRLEQVRNMVGSGARAMIIQGFSETGTLPPHDEIDQLLKLFLDFHMDHMSGEEILFPGVKEMILQLAEMKVPLGLCTNKSLRLTHKLMHKIGLTDYFTAIVGGDSFDYQKPDPRHLTSTLDMMDCPKDRAIMVGDSGNDIIPAQKAAMPVIAVSFGYTHTPVADFNPDMIIDHFDDFFKALKALCDARA